MRFHEQHRRGRANNLGTERRNPSMNKVTPCALISIDPDFRNTVKQVLTEARDDLALSVDVPVPFMEINEAHLRTLKDTRAELIFLDLEHDPEVGIQFAEYLAEAQPGRRFIGVGPVLTPELLIAAMRAGLIEFLPKPVASIALSDALARTERKRVAMNPEVREPGRVISFFSARGGAGSTTLATNLAIHIHKLTDKKVLLVDLDLELGELAVFLRLQPRFNVVDLARNLHRMDAELLASYLEQHSSGVHLLAAPYQPEKADTLSAEQTRELLRHLVQHFDYVLVDTARSFAAPVQAAMQEAEQIIVVTQVDVPSLRNIKRCLPLIERHAGSLEKLRLVVNRFDPASEISLDEVKRTLNKEITWKLADDTAHVMRSINTGEPVVLNGNGSDFVRDLKGFAAALAGVTLEPEERRNPLRAVRQLFQRNGKKKGAAAEAAV
jgi:pilus assembly protein CpaE